MQESQNRFKQYREVGNLEFDVTLSIDAEGVYKLLMSCDLQTLAEKNVWLCGVDLKDDLERHYQITLMV